MAIVRDAGRLAARHAGAIEIFEGRANGSWRPVIRHPANRKVPDAMVFLADDLADTRPEAARRLYRQHSSRVAGQLPATSLATLSIEGIWGSIGIGWVARQGPIGPTPPQTSGVRTRIALPRPARSGQAVAGL